MVLLLIAAPAAAQVDPGDARFRAAAALRGQGDLAGAAAGFERLADELPSSTWADDARMEAALAAIELGQYPRARRHLERLIADHPDSRLARRARAKLEGIVATIGAGGEWAAVAAEHDAIVRSVGDGDPAPAFERLEALLGAHPGYPRGFDARMWLGDGWLRQGRTARALTWYRDAAARSAEPAARFRAGKSAGDALLTAGDRDGADAAYRALVGQPGADAAVLDDAFEALALARARARNAALAWAGIAIVLIAGIAALRRDAGSWRAAARALARPPVEALFFAPVAALLIVASLGGNRLAAEAVIGLAIAGLAVAWGSGALLEAARRRGPVGAGRVLAHVVAAAVAVFAVGYLAMTRHRLLDMLIETWRHGPDRL